MRVKLNGTIVVLGPKDLIGQGGEASVYAKDGVALKLYHPATDRGSKRALHLRFDKLRAFPAGLPDRVLAPQALVTDLRGQPLGFAMRRILGAKELFASKLHPKEALTLFLGLYELLRRVHEKRVVVGDLNDGNVLVDDTGAYLIDADSMQFGSFPCLVAHEKTLAPELYGVDLEAGPSFTTGTDWYAFSVLLFSKVFGVHPFGGVHKQVKTLLRRIEAGHSVLRPDVRVPKSTLPFELLPDPLLDYFSRTFERKERTPPARSLLAVELSACARCGLEHARAACPACRRLGVLSARPAMRHRGRCLARVLFETRGSIVAAESAGGLRYLYREAGRLFREDRRPLALPAAESDQASVYSLGHAETWVASKDTAHLVGSDRIRRTLSIDQALGVPLFGGEGGHGAFVYDGWLEGADLPRRLGQVVPAEARIFAGHQLGYGFYRVGRLTHHFLFSLQQGGFLNLLLPPIAGRVRSVRATFDGTDVLVEIAAVAAGRSVHRIALVDRHARVVASHEGAPEDSPLLRHAGRIALFGRRLLVPTDDGLLLARAEQGLDEFVEGRVFTETEAFVSERHNLYPGPNGSVYVATEHELMQLELQKEGV